VPGQVLSREIEPPSAQAMATFWVPTLLNGAEGKTGKRRYREMLLDLARLRPVHARKHLERKPGDPVSVCGKHRPHRKVQGRTR